MIGRHLSKFLDFSPQFWGGSGKERILTDRLSGKPLGHCGYRHKGLSRFAGFIHSCCNCRRL